MWYHIYLGPIGVIMYKWVILIVSYSDTGKQRRIKMREISRHPLGYAFYYIYIYIYVTDILLHKIFITTLYLFVF